MANKIRAAAPSPGGARQQLIEAGERLFASRGIDAVSLAELTQAAGLRNTGAVHYYFGGREELLEAIVEEHRNALDRQRDQLLDDLEREGEPSAAEVVWALLEPLVAKLDDSRGRCFLSIQAQRMLRPREAPASPRPMTRRVHRLLDPGGRPRAVSRVVADFSNLLAFSALAQRAALEAEHGREAGVGRGRFVIELAAACARVHAAPEVPSPSQ